MCLKNIWMRKNLSGEGLANYSLGLNPGKQSRVKPRRIFLGPTSVLLYR